MYLGCRSAGRLAIATPLVAWAAIPEAAGEGDPSLAQSDEVIVVTGARTEQPLDETVVATEVVTREEIEASGAENAAELLEEHPGVEIFRSFRGPAVRLQGLDPDYVLVLIDGERTVGRIGGALDLSRFPVEESNA